MYYHFKDESGIIIAIPDYSYEAARWQLGLIVKDINQFKHFVP